VEKERFTWKTALAEALMLLAGGSGAADQTVPSRQRRATATQDRLNRVVPVSATAVTETKAIHMEPGTF
jgi:hypothetical protein